MRETDEGADAGGGPALFMVQAVARSAFSGSGAAPVPCLRFHVAAATPAQACERLLRVQPHLAAENLIFAERVADAVARADDVAVLPARCLRADVYRHP